jgi:adenosylcobinamide kinase/adenosylcobinamide-phosphate guanylyltransferase
MSEIIFITGGAKSGKSRLAEELAERLGAPLGYIATGEPKDAEMLERITRHRERRGPAWQTIEEPLNLVKVAKDHDDRFKGMLVDCITLWLANLLGKYNDPQRVLGEVVSFITAFPTLKTLLSLSPTRWEWESCLRTRLPEISATWRGRRTSSWQRLRMKSM